MRFRILEVKQFGETWYELQKEVPVSDYYLGTKWVKIGGAHSTVESARKARERENLSVRVERVVE